MPYDHEAEVRAFLATARMRDPEKHALVCAKYPVKSRHQMERIHRREIPVGLYPGSYASDQGRAVAGVTEATYAENALLGGDTAA